MTGKPFGHITESAVSAFSQVSVIIIASYELSVSTELQKLSKSFNLFTIDLAWK